MTDDLYEKWRATQPELKAAEKMLKEAEIELARANARYITARRASNAAYHNWIASRVTA